MIAAIDTFATVKGQGRPAVARPTLASDLQEHHEAKNEARSTWTEETRGRYRAARREDESL